MMDVVLGSLNMLLKLFDFEKLVVEVGEDVVIVVELVIIKHRKERDKPGKRALGAYVILVRSQ